MITVHHLENSRSQRILWFLEELGVDYEIRRYERDPKTMLGPKALFDVHPLGKSPVITDRGHTFAESGAIIEYLAATYGGEEWRLDSDPASAHVVRYWLHYAEGSLMPLLLMKLLFGRMGSPPMPLLMRPIAGLIGKGMSENFVAPRLRTHLGFMEQHLQNSQWFAGDRLSVADIQMSFPLEAAMTRVAMDDMPKIREFVAKVQARDAYKRALERGGPYAYA